MVEDKYGAGIKVGDPVLQRYPHREKLKRDPFRGTVTRISKGPEGHYWYVEYREHDTWSIRNGNVETIEYDWNFKKERE